MTTPTTVNVRLQLRADTAANWTAANPILLANEVGLETDTKKLKVGNGSSAWNSLAYFPSIVSGGTVLGNLEIGSTGTLTFEGSTADGFETTLAVTNPTADRTITLPNQSGTVVVSGNASIVDADIAANAEIAVSKLADGSARQLLQTDAAGTGVEWTSNVDIPGTLDVTGTATFDGAVTVAGDLTVNGTTTTISTQNLLVEDKNIIIGDVATPTDTTADGGGITLKGATDKTINWVDSTDAWTSSERFSVPLGSAASPSLTFTGDENSGVYSPGADQVAISTGGSGRLFVGSTGQIGISQSSLATGGFTAGTLRIGHSTGQTAGVLLQNTSTAADSSFWYTDGTDSFLGSNNGFFAHFAGGSERLRITSAGLVGVGTSSPAGLFHANTTNGNVSYFGGPIGITNGNYTGICIGYTELNGTYAKSMIVQEQKGDGNARGTIHILNNNAGTSASATLADARLSITSAGNVGVATATPSETLHINGTARLGTTAHTFYANNIACLSSSADTTIDASSAQLILKAGSGEAARLDSSKRLLVGTSSDSGGALLQVNGDRIRVGTAKTPASATATGTAGEICWDASYVYVCTATNTWKRSALSTW